MGLMQLPSSLKLSTWKEYAIITFAFSVNAGNFLVPALAVTQGNLPWIAAFLAVWIGALLAFLCVSALSIPGALYGLPGQYILRTFVGSWLSNKNRFSHTGAHFIILVQRTNHWRNLHPANCDFKLFGYSYPICRTVSYDGKCNGLFSHCWIRRCKKSDN